jgi:hypothetical protein
LERSFVDSTLISIWWRSSDQRRPTQHWDQETDWWLPDDYRALLTTFHDHASV